MFKLLYRLNAHNLLAFATKFREPYHNTETCYILHAHSHAPQTLLLKLLDNPRLQPEQLRTIINTAVCFHA